MAKKKLEKLSKADFIPGIYNFCDKCCEKCTQSSKCMCYAVEREMEEKLGGLAGESLHKQETKWIYLKNVFDATYEILRGLTEERGIDMEAVYAAGEVENRFWHDEYMDSLPDEESYDLGESAYQIVQLCIIYEQLYEECLEKVLVALDEKEWTPEIPERKEIENVLDRISWYAEIFSAKIRRAIFALYCSLEAGKNIYEDEYCGASKVALAAIRTSDRAWEALKKYDFLSVIKEIAHVQVALRQLHRDIEAQFPEVREFRLPGFDD